MREMVRETTACGVNGLLHGQARSGDVPGEGGSTGPPAGSGWKRRSVVRLGNRLAEWVRGGSESTAVASSPASRPRFRNRRARRGQPSRQGWQASAFTWGCSAMEPAPRRRGQMTAIFEDRRRFDLVQIAIRPHLQSWESCFLGVRPDNYPIFERTGQPSPASLFRRPPVRVPQGSAPRCRAAYRSSALNDQAYADGRHPRGGNPRSGAGW